jgi:hypothetical protein
VQYSGYYVFEFDGNGYWYFNGNGFTIVPGPVTGPNGSVSTTNVTVLSANRWQTTADASPVSNTHTRLVFTYTGPAALIGVVFQGNDLNNSGANVRNIKLYRLDDKADLDAGKVFRTPYKQQLVNLCPSAMRFMDWHGFNDCNGTLFTGRTLPTNAAYGGSHNWTTSPVYDPIVATGVPNQFSTGAATPTSGNPKTMPVTPKHGEVVVARVDGAGVRGNNWSVTNVTNAATGVVTAAGHGFNNGDIVIILFDEVQRGGNTTLGNTTFNGGATSGISAGITLGTRIDGLGIPQGTIVTGTPTADTITMSNPATVTSTVGIQAVFEAMPKLHRYPIKVTNKTTNTFEAYTVGGTPINTTTMGTFSGTARVTAYPTLNVGNRGAYPIIYSFGTIPAFYYGETAISQGQYNCFKFDKSMSMTTDGAGNQIMGVWIFTENQNVAYDGGGVPIEICVALVNELNAMGPVRTINCWLNIPFLGMSSMDADYNAADNWGIGLANVAINGAGTWPGLAGDAKVYIEYANETWNMGGSPFTLAWYLASRGRSRWGTSKYDKVNMSTLRSVVAINDIKLSPIYNSDRMKLVLAGQGSEGTKTAGINQLKIDGMQPMVGDVAYPNSANAPMTYHDYFAFAGYFEAGQVFDDANLTTLTTQWATAANASNTTNMNAAIAAYVVGVGNSSLAECAPYPATTETGTQTPGYYGQVLLPGYVSKMAAYGKAAIMYEGGWQKLFTLRVNTPGQPYMPAVLTSGSTSITVDPGQYAAVVQDDFVYGYGIPANTSIASKTAPNILVLRRAATISTTNGSIMVFSPQNAFLWAVKRSPQWSAELIAYFNRFVGANLGMPADYLQMNLQWGHTWPTAYGYTNTEWGDLSQVMLDEGARNRALPA